MEAAADTGDHRRRQPRCIKGRRSTFSKKSPSSSRSPASAADVFVDAEPAAAIVQVRATCAAAYKMTDADCDQLLDEIAVKTKEVIPLFEINIGGVANYEAILKKANEALVELTPRIADAGHQAAAAEPGPPPEGHHRRPDRLKQPRHV